MVIGCDTAFFGAPVENYLDDRRLFIDIFYRYYIDFESGNSWVARVDGQVVGVVMGRLDTSLRQQRWSRKIFPLIVWKAIQGKYRLGLRTLRYAWAMVKAVLRREYCHADKEVYPAHLHVNIDSGWRGQGLGRALMEAYLTQLRQLGVPGVHLMTTSLNKAAWKLYEELGFGLMDSRRTHLWEHFFEQPVDNRCYGLKLF